MVDHYKTEVCGVVPATDCNKALSGLCQLCFAAKRGVNVELGQGESAFTCNGAWEYSWIQVLSGGGNKNKTGTDDVAACSNMYQRDFYSQSELRRRLIEIQRPEDIRSHRSRESQPKKALRGESSTQPSARGRHWVYVTEADMAAGVFQESSGPMTGLGSRDSGLMSSSMSADSTSASAASIRLRHRPDRHSNPIIPDSEIGAESDWLGDVHALCSSSPMATVSTGTPGPTRRESSLPQSPPRLNSSLRKSKRQSATLRLGAYAMQQLDRSCKSLSASKSANRANVNILESPSTHTFSLLPWEFYTYSLQSYCGARPTSLYHHHHHHHGLSQCNDHLRP